MRDNLDLYGRFQSGGLLIGVHLNNIILPTTNILIAIK
jgi:hypothetical protein